MKFLVCTITICFIYFLQAQQLQLFDTLSGFPFNSVNSVDIDQSGNVWMINSDIGGGGILKFDGTNATFWSHTNSLDICELKVIGIDNNDVPWVGGNKWLLKYNGSSFDTININPYFFNSSFYDIDFDNNNDVYLSNWYFNGSIMKYNHDSLSVEYEQNDSSFFQHLDDIHINNGIIWFAIDGFLGKFDGQNYSFFTQPNIFNISDITSDQLGNIWVCGNSGAAKFDGTNWTTFTDADYWDLYGNTAIAVDQNGIVYVGNFGKYVTYNGTNWSTHQYNENGISYNSASTKQIKVDQNNNVWFATTRGLFLNGILQAIDKNVKEDIIVYPNPFQESFKVQIKLNQSWQLTDVNGNIVCTEKNEENLNSISKGLYFFQLFEDKQLIYTSKVIKN